MSYHVFHPTSSPCLALLYCFITFLVLCFEARIASAARRRSTVRQLLISQEPLSQSWERNPLETWISTRERLKKTKRKREKFLALRELLSSSVNSSSSNTSLPMWINPNPVESEKSLMKRIERGTDTANPTRRCLVSAARIFTPLHKLFLTVISHRRIENDRIVHGRKWMEKWWSMREKWSWPRRRRKKLRQRQELEKQMSGFFLFRSHSLNRCRLLWTRPRVWHEGMVFPCSCHCFFSLPSIAVPFWLSFQFDRSLLSFSFSTSLREEKRGIVMIGKWRTRTTVELEWWNGRERDDRGHDVSPAFLFLCFSALRIEQWEV